MSDYDELYKQHQELTKRLEEAKKEEANKAIETIRELIIKFGLRPEDYALNSPVKKPLKAKKRFQYRDPASDKEWNGHGRAPDWIKDKSEEEREGMRVKPDRDQSLP